MKTHHMLAENNCYEVGSRFVNRKSKAGNAPDRLASDSKSLAMKASHNIQSARVEPQNRRRSYRAQKRAAAKRRNVAKRGGAR